MTASRPYTDYIVDTSVVLKWYVQRGESDVTKAFQLLDAYAGGQCALRAPELLLWEVANALAIGHKLKPAKVLEALAHLRALELDLNAVKWSTLQSAVEIASASEATVYDSYYLALALESGNILVTADEKFLRKVAHYSSIVSLTQLQIPGVLI